MVRVFIGTSPYGDDKDAEKVLEYTLRKNCSEPIEIVFMRNDKNIDNFFSNFNDEPWWTPFSYLRWAIPEYCDFKGRALYMDVDQVNFKDISKLFYMDMEGRSVAIRESDKRTCVMLMDCEKLEGKLPLVKDLKVNPPKDLSILVSKILNDSTYYDKRWNCLDGEDLRSSNIWHLHFTEMTTQPWSPPWAKDAFEKKGKPFIRKQHPRGDLVYIWKYLLKEASNV
jgi:hypothetical protein